MTCAPLELVIFDCDGVLVDRALQDCRRPHAAHRVDHGKPRVLSAAKRVRYCELIAALKLRTTNKNGRHHGYSIKDLVEQFDSKAGEIKALFNNTLDATRTGRCARRCCALACRYDNLQLAIRRWLHAKSTRDRRRRGATAIGGRSQISESPHRGV
jgi:hypothetical protein